MKLYFSLPIIKMNYINTFLNILLSLYSLNIPYLVMGYFLNMLFNLNYFFKDFIHLFLESGREGERKGEKHQCVVAFRTPPTRDLVSNPGMCPDWESNWGPCSLQASTQYTKPHQPGLV